MNIIMDGRSSMYKLDECSFYILILNQVK